MLQAEKRFVMTRITKITACLICICAVFGTASCGKKASLPDVRDLGQILTVSREEGSGTRTEFDMNMKVTEQNADQVVSSTKDMLETVASTKNAIGYVAYSAIANELDSGITADDKTDKLSLSRQSADYKMIKVDGVEVSDKTIRSGKYALCRDYYVAYKGKLNSVEQDFLRYIMSAGQKEVDKICVGKKKAATFLSDKSEGTISIEGSSSVAPIMEKLIAGYASYNPKATITLKTTDSSDGLNAAIRGDCDLAMSSRALKDYEKELLAYEVIGSDAIAIVLQKNNPITDLSTKQIRDIYNEKYPKWSAIN